MIRISLAQYNKIHPDFRGVWTNESQPEWIGRRTALSGAIEGLELGYLAIEGISFEIFPETKGARQ